MPDISMVQQAPNRSTASEKPYCNGASTFLAPLDDVAPTMTTTTTTQALLLHGTFTGPHDRIQTQTLSRSSQSQAVQVLTGGISSVVDCAGTPFHDRTVPLLDLYIKKANCSPRQPIKTPVMHPNLVCTLKSILNSPKTESDTLSGFSSSGDSRCTHHSGSPPIQPEIIMAETLQGSFEERISALAAEDSSSKAGSPENTSWPKIQVPAKCKLLQQEAVLVPVDLIQNRRPYQCAFAGCQRTFKNPQTMRMHHRTHFTDAAAAAAAAATAAKLGADHSAAVMAPGCGSSLKAGHNKKIPSRCPTCYKTFVGLYELRRHFGRKHSEGEKRHACRKCGKRFHIEVDVRDHEKLCGEPIACRCGMKFAFKCNLVAHKRTHPKCQDPPTMDQETEAVTIKKNVITPENTEQSSKKRKLDSETSLVESSPRLEVGATVPATQASSPQLSPVQPFAILDSASASSSSPFSSTTSSPSTSVVAEALPDFDVTSSSSSLDNYNHYSCLSSSGLLLHADNPYSKFPFQESHYFLAYQAVPLTEAQYY